LGKGQSGPKARAAAEEEEIYDECGGQGGDQPSRQGAVGEDQGGEAEVATAYTYGGDDRIERAYAFRMTTTEHPGSGYHAAWVTAGILAMFNLTATTCAGEPLGGPEFPDELVHFEPGTREVIFAGTGKDTWDRKIRERSYILREGETWRLWYNGYNDRQMPTHFLGYATSRDGWHWTRSSEAPIYDQGWVEDICVVKHAGAYYLFSEGRDDIAHLLTSTDGQKWTERGNLDIRNVAGHTITPGPYGTPAVWVEDGVWYLFYERNDAAEWLATSRDLKTWTNLQDEPVLKCGPEAYDKFAVAFDQVIKYQGRYYAYYHASAHPKWKEWSTNLAVSTDLVHWKKYPDNPVLPVDPTDPERSSAFLVQEGNRFRLYATHPDVKIFVSKQAAAGK
jgi:beta-1,2-mannobiose phosphorylase / 1,2-beta-oligomannan phosphorylase